MCQGSFQGSNVPGTDNPLLTQNMALLQQGTEMQVLWKQAQSLWKNNPQNRTCKTICHRQPIPKSCSPKASQWPYNLTTSMTQVRGSPVMTRAGQLSQHRSAASQVDKPQGAPEHTALTWMAKSIRPLILSEYSIKSNMNCTCCTRGRWYDIPKAKLVICSKTLRDTCKCKTHRLYLPFQKSLSRLISFQEACSQ